MSKKVELLNQFVADLGVLNVKFHNMHWNVTGDRFVPVHEHLEAMYDMFFEQYDEVAERLKMLGEFPLASLKSYLETSKVQELENKDYGIDEVYAIVLDELQKARKLATDIRNLADDEGDFGTVAMLEDIVGAYDKEIWFIEQINK